MRKDGRTSVCKTCSAAVTPQELVYHVFMHYEEGLRETYNELRDHAADLERRFVEMEQRAVRAEAEVESLKSSLEVRDWPNLY